jgi:hypothetical protein
MIGCTHERFEQLLYIWVRVDIWNKEYPRYAEALTVLTEIPRRMEKIP